MNISKNQGKSTHTQTISHQKSQNASSPVHLLVTRRWPLRGPSEVEPVCRNPRLWFVDPCTAKCRPTSAPDVPVLRISNAISGSFPYKRGLVAFVNIEELTAGFYGQDRKTIKQTQNVRKTHPYHVGVSEWYHIKMGRHIRHISGWSSRFNR